MVNEFISKDDITKQRTPSELWDWLIQRVELICSTQEGEKAFRMQKGLIKQLVEEINVLAIFGKHKYGDTEQVLLQPVIGNQNYDAVVTDFRTKPASKTYIEITQAHEGENDYWRRCQLLEKGFVPLHSPVIKTRIKKTKIQVSIPFEANSVEDRVKIELEMILDAARKKEHIDYPSNTFLIISFEDLSSFREVMDDKKLDIFTNENIITLDLRFSALYLVGRLEKTFREYNFIKKI